MSKVETFLEHHGVKGQKWGVRRNRFTNQATKTAQKRIDRVDKVATGKATGGDKFKAAVGNLVFTQKSAQKAINRSARNQESLLSGEHQVALWFNDRAFSGIKVRDLKFHKRVVPS